MGNSQSFTLPYEETGAFSKLVIDYLNKKATLLPFIQEYPDIASMGRQIDRKRKQLLNRTLLVDVLKEQYDKNGIRDASSLIDKLQSENTFTICSAHQPNIFTGYLYVIYKIVQTIKLAEIAKKEYPQYDFVPVFYIGSEDNDIEEIGEFYFKDKRYQWQPDEKGACGRISTTSLLTIRDEILSQFGSSEAEKKLRKQLLAAYDGNKTLAQATSYFLHLIFQDYGLLCLDADDKRCKEVFKHVMYDELVHQRAFNIVSEHNKKLAKQYKIQATPREINLFYIDNNVRTRIIKEDQLYSVDTSKLSNDQKSSEWPINNVSLLAANNLSPNAILRPLYQESLLPNVAFVGGGGEIAYWCELKSLFDFYEVTYPLLIVRSSLSVVNKKELNKILKLGLSESFRPLENLLKQKTQEHPAYIQLLNNLDTIENKYAQIILYTEKVQEQLEISVSAQIAKIQRLHERIKVKYRAHLKREFDTYVLQRTTIHDALFPGDVLQERRENYIELICRHKENLIPSFMQHINLFDNSYRILAI